MLTIHPTPHKPRGFNRQGCFTLNRELRNGEWLVTGAKQKIVPAPLCLPILPWRRGQAQMEPVPVSEAVDNEAARSDAVGLLDRSRARITMRALRGASRIARPWRPADRIGRSPLSDRMRKIDLGGKRLTRPETHHEMSKMCQARNLSYHGY